MCKEKHTKLGHTQFIPGGKNESRKQKKVKDKMIKDTFILSLLQKYGS